MFMYTRILNTMYFFSGFLWIVVYKNISFCAKYQCEIFMPFGNDINGNITIALERMEELENRITFDNRSTVITIGMSLMCCLHIEVD